MKCNNKSLTRKKTFFESRLSDSFGKPKELWQELKSLDLPNKTSVISTNNLKGNIAMSLKKNSTVAVFINYYST